MSETLFPASPLPGPLTVYRRAAMASDFEVSLNATRDDFGSDAALDALDEIDRIEDVLSIFRPTTPISRVNLLASEMNIRVDDEIWDWLQTAIRIGEETGGAFDVAAAPIWRAWGFAKRDGEFPSPEAIRDALQLSGTRHLRLDDAARTVAFDAPGVELNFGAIGKGFALDSAAQKLENGGVGDFLIQGGTSGAVARGSRRNDFWTVFPSTAREVDEEPDFDEESGRPLRSKRRENREAFDALLPEFLKSSPEEKERARLENGTRLDGWTIGVSHPLFPEKRLGEILLRDRALSTSGSTRQFFRAGGKRYSHIVDPRTGWPTLGVLTTTVLAPTAAEADALSTAFFVLGPEKTAEFCANRPELGVLMVLEQEMNPGFALKTFNLGPDVFRLTD